MTNKTIILFLTILTFNLAFGQDTEKYLTLVKEAQTLSKNKKYLDAGRKYSSAFIALGNRGYVPDRYNSAQCWAKAKVADSAFIQLFKIINRGSYTNDKQLASDKKLKSLHSDKRWNELLTLIKTNKEKAEAKLNKTLIATLDTIMREDQDYRLKIDRVEKIYGSHSSKVTLLWKTIQEKDSINLIKVKAILDKYGWLGPDVVGQEGASAIFLVIQHSDKQTQVQYVPMMREAVKNGKASPSSLALLEDRLALRQGKKQIYGSQIGFDPKTDVGYIFPLEDPDNVDKRRKEVGLGLLSDYVKRWNIVWDIEQYKKDLPALEEKTKNVWQ
jgi:hypothetical protein